jgi:hypothetical protein
MSVVDGSQSLDELGLSGVVLERNRSLIAHIRTLLARKDVTRFSDLMSQFAELLEDCGPLAFLRFDAQAFDQAVRAGLGDQHQRANPEELCDALHLACVPKLLNLPFLRYFRRELQTFVSLSYVPAQERAAACAALLTTPLQPQRHHLQAVELPAIYALFRVQLVGWMLVGGNT